MYNLVYWSPFIGNVGTIKSCLNSAIAAKKFAKGKNSVKIINVFGEWNKHIKIFNDNEVEVINFFPNLIKYFPNTGYLKSRILYIFIFVISFVPLLKFLKKEKECYFIAHLITSLPLMLNFLFNLKCKMILRISGYPKLNIFRKTFWRIVNSKIYLLTCPTYELFNKISNLNFLNSNKIKVLPDAIINMHEFIEQKKRSKSLSFDKKIILSAGRFTKQKNFKFMINELSDFLLKNQNYDLVILGDGEEKKEIEKLIQKLNMKDRIHMPGFKENPMSYMIKADIFILPSLWEEVGFVIVEAALSNLLVISSDCPNGPKEFLDNGEAGFLFASNEKNALKSTILKIDDDNKKKK